MTSVRYVVDVNGHRRQVTVQRADGRFAVDVDGRSWTVDAVRVDGGTLSLLIGDASHEITFAADPLAGGFVVGVGGTPLAVTVNGWRRAKGPEGSSSEAAHGPQRIVAPMPGKIARVLVKKGEPVRARQAVVVIEAMKMENELRAGSDGTLAEIHVQDGQSVEAGALLAVIHR